MPSSIFSSEDLTRFIPLRNWKKLATISFLIFFVLIGCWEIFWRGQGYRPGLNDNKDLWVLNREKVSTSPDSTVIIGSSRILFGFNLAVWEKAFGDKPLQLATVGTNPTVYLHDIANNTNFKGILFLEIVPGLFFVPDGNPIDIPTNNVRALKDFSLAQRWSHYLGIPLEMSLAFLEQDDLPLKKLLENLPIRERKSVPLYPIPPMFHEVDHDRQARMTRRPELDAAFAQKIKDIWKIYFTPPSPPKGIPSEVFGKMMTEHMEKVLQKAQEDIKKIQDRGGKVIMVRYPSTGSLKELEDRFTPREVFWERIVKETKPELAIYYSDHEVLRHFTCPEDSHLTREDAVKFTQGLVGIVRNHFL